MLNEVLAELHALNLGAMATRLSLWAADPSNTEKSHMECVHALVDAQIQAVLNKRAEMMLRRADLPTSIALAGVWTGNARGLPPSRLSNLAMCNWMRLGQTVVVTGPCRTGKTYLIAALAREAVLLRASVRYWRVPDLLAACAVEKARGNWPAFLKGLQRLGLLVLDDFATERATNEQSHLLRQIIDSRLRLQRAVMVASANAISDWDGYFEDATAADAIFGRLLEKVHAVDLKRTKPKTDSDSPKGH